MKEKDGFIDKEKDGFIDKEKDGFIEGQISKVLINLDRRKRRCLALQAFLKSLKTTKKSADF